MKYSIVTLLCLWFCATGQMLNAQQYVPGEFLVQLHHPDSLEAFIHANATWEKYPTKLSPKRRLIPDAAIWQVTADTTIPTQRLLDMLRQDPRVALAQLNHRIEYRNDRPTQTLPNDPLYFAQWQYNNTGASGGTVDADLDMDLAWDKTTGGLSTQGDTIVVAVLDDGINLSHPDLQQNIWHNWNEIPNNNIDDDNNGYIDDYAGWYSVHNSGDISLPTTGGHGTPVAGIIGADGNNNLGVSGINWTVKLMIIRNDFNTTEAEVLAAYGYPLYQRRLYNQTNGAQGAFVVATNASWGVNLGKASDAPIWCAFYDTLGQEGILNVGATTNSNTNVDVLGDLPTTCPSDYLIGVTNLDKYDGKVPNAGYGVQHIDLGAYGEGTYTLTHSGYGTFGGTSSAAPHVAGTIALLYAANCNTLIELAKISPSRAALFVREALLSSVQPNSSLASITQTGGRLNTNNALDSILAQCPTNSCFEPLEISHRSPNDTETILTWNILSNVTQVQVDLRPAGSATWITQPNNSLDSIRLQNLLPCQDYEVRLYTNCGAATSPHTTYNFRSNGCCSPPTQFQVGQTQPQTTTLTWQPFFAAQFYEVDYRNTNHSTWQTVSGLTGTSVQLSGLQDCNNYEARIRAFCNTGVWTAYADTLKWETKGCGFCKDANYCAVTANTAFEWVNAIRLNGLNYTSGENGGYFSHENDSILRLERGKTYPIEVDPGYKFTPANEYVHVFLDVNLDGQFTSSEFLQTLQGTNTITGNFTIPNQTQLGMSRLRVITLYNRPNPPDPCRNSASGTSMGEGEIEDFCVQIIEKGTSTTEAMPAQTWTVYPNPTSNEFILSTPQWQGNAQAQLYGLNGQLLQSWTLSQAQTRLNLNAQAAGMYILQVRVKGQKPTYLRVIKSTSNY